MVDIAVSGLQYQLFTSLSQMKQMCMQDARSPHDNTSIYTGPFVPGHTEYPKSSA